MTSNKYSPPQASACRLYESSTGECLTEEDLHITEREYNALIVMSVAGYPDNVDLNVNGRLVCASD